MNGDVNGAVLRGFATVEPYAETELLRRAAQGDRSAFDLLYAQQHKAVFDFAWRFSRSFATAEDITQDTFVTLLLEARRYRSDRGPVRNWLLGIARNLALRQFRKVSRELPLDLETEASRGEGQTLPADALAREFDMQAAIGSLPPLNREVLILFEYEGLTLSEIAELTGVELAAVKSRLHRARERLRLLLAPLRDRSAKTEDRREDDGNE